MGISTSREQPRFGAVQAANALAAAQYEADQDKQRRLRQLQERLAHLEAQQAQEARDALPSRLAGLSMATQDVSLVSHAHGRQRREERGIARAELQAAVKHGRREPAHPGRDGKERWRFTHKGVVYVTDATCRHEITSWRLDDGTALAPVAPLAPGAGAATSHTVIVVDHSGSMRKADVPGYASRTEAVYTCLLREFVEPQLALQADAPGKLAKALVTLVELSDDARVAQQLVPVDASLCKHVKARARSNARSHGNYLPALQTVETVLRAHDSAAHLVLIFLSDGAPSDHLDRECMHGVQVWHAEPGGGVLCDGKQKLQQCGSSAAACRLALRRDVTVECCQRIERLGDLFGRERMHVHTVAFGPPDENYEVLKQMAAVLPRSSFQKLGLRAEGLSSAFSSLNSSLTTLRSEVCGSSTGLTRRSVPEEDAKRSGWLDSSNWNLYHVHDSSSAAGKLVRKYHFDLLRRDFVATPLSAGATGVAIYSRTFAKGSERIAFRCTEVGPAAGGNGWKMVGERMVAKETHYVEKLLNARFHETLAQTQAEAEALARVFNTRVRSNNPGWEVHFVDTQIYEVQDVHYPEGRAWIAAEPELDGAFTKWNNNAGAVLRTPSGGDGSSGGSAQYASAGLGAILESDEDEDAGESAGAICDVDVPQCFSHFTWSVTSGELLVCDLQGVWNATDGFLLTDPAMHRAERRSRGRRRGSTDKGTQGIASFFATHTCSPLCRRLGLTAYTPGM